MTALPDGASASQPRNWTQRWQRAVEEYLEEYWGAKWGEVPQAFVTLKPGTSPSAEDLIAFTRQHLAGFKCPKTVHSLPELPRNAMGKVQKNELRKQFGGG